MCIYIFKFLNIYSNKYKGGNIEDTLKQLTTTVNTFINIIIMVHIMNRDANCS